MHSPPHSPSRTDLAQHCVKCGLCLPHCPTYALVGMEAESPRGRIALMANLAENPSQSGPFRHLDSCLGCRRCEAVCPTNTAYEQLLLQTRAVLPPALRWREKCLLWLLAHKSLLNGALACYRRVYPALPKRWRCLPKPDIILLDAPAQAKNAIFSGCIGDTYEQNTRAALLQLLRACGESAAIPKAQVCCGQAARHAGQTASAAALAAANHAAFKGFARVLVLASGCHSALTESLGIPVVDALDFLAEHAEALHFRPAHGRHVALHIPCSAAFQGADRATRTLLARIPGLRLSLLPNAGCCGGAGLYPYNQPEHAAAMRTTLLASIPADAELLLSANIGCRLHLAGDKPVQHPLAFMADYLL